MVISRCVLINVELPVLEMAGQPMPIRLEYWDRRESVSAFRSGANHAREYYLRPYGVSRVSRIARYFADSGKRLILRYKAADRDCIQPNRSSTGAVVDVLDAKFSVGIYSGGRG